MEFVIDFYGYQFILDIRLENKAWESIDKKPEKFDRVYQWTGITTIPCKQYKTRIRLKTKYGDFVNFESNITISPVRFCSNILILLNGC